MTPFDPPLLQPTTAGKPHRIPLDFLKDSFNANDVEQRLPLAAVFNKGEHEYKLCTKEELVGQLHGGSRLVQCLAKPKLMARLDSLFNARYHNNISKDGKVKTFTYGPRNKEVRNFADFAGYIRQLTNMTKEIREMVFFVLHGMWEKSNPFLAELEKELLVVLGWEYTKYLVDGTEKERNHDGGCVKRILVKLKNRMLECVKNAMKGQHKEAIMVRRPARPAKDLKIIKEVHVGKHGYSGLLGLFETHPDLLIVDNKETKALNDYVQSVMATVTTKDSFIRKVFDDFQAEQRPLFSGEDEDGVMVSACHFCVVSSMNGLLLVILLVSNII